MAISKTLKVVPSIARAFFIGVVAEPNSRVVGKVSRDPGAFPGKHETSVPPFDVLRALYLSHKPPLDQPLERYAVISTIRVTGRAVASVHLREH